MEFWEVEYWSVELASECAYAYGLGGCGACDACGACGGARPFPFPRILPPPSFRPDIMGEGEGKSFAPSFARRTCRRAQGKSRHYTRPTCRWLC